MSKVTFDFDNNYFYLCIPGENKSSCITIRHLLKPEVEEFYQMLVKTSWYFPILDSCGRMPSVDFSMDNDIIHITIEASEFFTIHYMISKEEMIDAIHDLLKYYNYDVDETK